MLSDFNDHEINAWAGGFAGLVSGVLLYPAETVSARYKVGGRNVLTSLLRNEGVLALWNGAPAGLLGTVPSSALYFVAYEHMKRLGERALITDDRMHLLPLVHLSSGALSEAMTSIVYVPFEVTKARMMLGSNPNRASNGHISSTNNYSNSLQALYKIAKHEGRRGLYAGYVPCMFTDMSFRGVTFMLYEFGKRQLVEHRGGEINESSVEDLMLGLVCGGLAAFITNPLDLITIRAMTRAMGSDLHGLQGGVGNIWRGAGCRMASLAPQSAMTLAMFEGMLRLMNSKN